MFTAVQKGSDLMRVSFPTQAFAVMQEVMPMVQHLGFEGQPGSLLGL